MRTVHIDADRHQWVGTGSVQPMVKWAIVNGQRTRTDEQDTGPHGLPKWSVECIAVAPEERDRTEVVQIAVEAPGMPDCGAFGTPLQFEGLTMSVYPRGDRQLGQSFTATGVRQQGQATGRSRTSEAA